MGSTHQQPKTKPYFGYGSNLWLDQMRRRCPDSIFTGIGRLKGYTWFINSRGYANVAPVTSEEEKEEEEEEVWGLVYDLTPADEAKLDVNEGVPEAYEKRMVGVEFWPCKPEEAEGEERGEGKVVEMLVYIDFKRNKPGFKPRDEYIVRMNHGIDDALEQGIPKSYVDRVLRGYIPEQFQTEEEEKKARDLAKKQAGRFVDESGVVTPLAGSNSEDS
ncbi:hypothetical protein QBC35DRAFT_410835 [Podospora australis]|uniref:gamma-glutamylcyclotransferase n=1 Tax=Podospora australis TaxID=1536484 RepID=A0AAN7AHB4_9PEZI|nr:hypothetical protein QBC35DRAFT_410835 [Podospora australis]